LDTPVAVIFISTRREQLRHFCEVNRFHDHAHSSGEHFDDWDRRFSAATRWIRTPMQSIPSHLGADTVRARRRHVINPC
jgi:hypothetical protein